MLRGVDTANTEIGRQHANIEDSEVGASCLYLTCGLHPLTLGGVLFSLTRTHEYHRPILFLEEVYSDHVFDQPIVELPLLGLKCWRTDHCTYTYILDGHTFGRNVWGGDVFIPR